MRSPREHFGIDPRHGWQYFLGLYPGDVEIARAESGNTGGEQSLQGGSDSEKFCLCTEDGA
jgi:hypothetical protein